jgi:ActR/RegA family two-component response regulator
VRSSVFQVRGAAVKIVEVGSRKYLEKSSRIAGVFETFFAGENQWRRAAPAFRASIIIQKWERRIFCR